MKLSEAIRLGAMVKPQSFDGTNRNKDCAIQAACTAHGLKTKKWWLLYQRPNSLYPWMKELRKHPIYGTILPIATIIWDLNDRLHWTRERTADWVATIEPQEIVCEQPIESMTCTQLVG